MPPPVGNIAIHDIVVNAQGFMRESLQKPPVENQDGQPGIARSAGGEGSLDYFQNDAFEAWVSGSGGQGQARKIASDKYLTGIGRSEHPGQFHPAMKVLYEANGGSESWYFRLGSDLYGFGTATVTKVGSVSTWVRPAGTVLQQPVVSSNGYAFWVQTDGATTDQILVRWVGEGNAATDISPGYDPLHVSMYGRHMFLFAEHTLSITPKVEQSVSATGFGENWSVSWPEPTKQGSHLFLVLSQGTETAVVTAPPEPVPDDALWGGVAAKITYNPGPSSAIRVWAIPASPQRSGTERVRFIAGSGPHHGNIVLIEVSGLAKGELIEDFATYTDNSDNTSSTGTLAEASTGSFRMGIRSIYRTSEVSIWGSSTGTEILRMSSLRGAVGGFTPQLRTIIAWSDSLNVMSNSNTSSTPQTGLIISIPKTALTLAVKQLIILATDNDGQTWEPAPGGIATGELGNIRATRAADEQLYVATDRGLWAMTYGENEFGTDVRINIAIRGKLDDWEIPPTDNLGKHLAVYDNGIYFPVGGSVRRFVRGVVGPAERLIWPRQEWANISGKVQALVSGEGGLYYGSAGYLWNYTGEGYHAHAVEPAAGAFDYLHWHDGKLYMKGNPAPYLNYGYPNMRPDQTTLTPARYADSVFVSSSLDFGKVDMRKFIRRFVTHARFTDTNVLNDSGTLTLQYLQGCTPFSDPGRLGGGADSLDWVTIGTHTRADGYAKTHILSDANLIKCYRLFLRIKLTVGANGWPIPEGVVAFGRTEMPDVRLLSPVLEISTSIRDKNNEQLYPTQADVVAALDALYALRTDVPFTVTFQDDDSGGSSFLCSMISLTTSKIEDSRVSGATRWLVQLQLLEVP